MEVMIRFSRLEKVFAKAMEKKLLLINAGVNVIRFIPALIAEKKHVDEMMTILEDCID